MMAYTRWGTQWSGANAGLIRGILNNEWGCNGLQITDNVITSMVSAIDGVLGGTTTYDSMLVFMLMGDDGFPGYEEDPVVVQAMREACHHNLYAIANSCGMNGVGPDTTIKVVTPGPITAVKVALAVFVVLAVASAIMWFRRVKKFKTTEDYAAYQEFKKSLKK